MPLPRSAGLQGTGAPSPCRLCHAAHSREADRRGNRRPREGLEGASCHARSVLCKHGSGSREGNGCKGGKGEGRGRKKEGQRTVGPAALGWSGQQRNPPLTLDRKAEGPGQRGLRGCQGLLEPPGGRDRATEGADGVGQSGVKAPEKGLQKEVGLRGASRLGGDPSVLTPTACSFVCSTSVCLGSTVDQLAEVSGPRAGPEATTRQPGPRLVPQQRRPRRLG